jgi:hypothetical protein
MMRARTTRPRTSCVLLRVAGGAESTGVRRFPNPNGGMMEASEGRAFVDETVRESLIPLAITHHLQKGRLYAHLL